MESWKRYPIEDLCESIVDCVNKTAPTVDYETPYKMIRTTNVRNGWVNLTSVKFVEQATFDKWTRRQVPQFGDIILTREAPLGEVGMLRSNDQVFLGQRTVAYRVDPERADRRFVLYAMQSHDVQSQIKAFASGSTVEHMRVPDCGKFEILCPPLPIQSRIADILSAYDDLIEVNTRRIAILGEMARRTYEEWFVRDKNLPKATLKDIAELVMGQSPKSDYYNDSGEGLPFHQGVTNFGNHYPAHEQFSTAGNREAQIGDILFSVRAPVGRINVAPSRLILGRGLAAIRSKSSTQNLLLSALKFEFSEEDKIGNGAIFKAVTKADMENIELPCPTEKDAKQGDIVLGSYWSMVGNLVKQNTNLRAQRDLLLPRLVSGEIDVSDAASPEKVAAE